MSSDWMRSIIQRLNKTDIDLDSELIVAEITEDGVNSWVKVENAATLEMLEATARHIFDTDDDYWYGFRPFRSITEAKSVYGNQVPEGKLRSKPQLKQHVIERLHNEAEQAEGLGAIDEVHKEYNDIMNAYFIEN